MTEAASWNLAWLSRLMAGLSTIGLIASPALDIFAYLFPGGAHAVNIEADQTGALLNDSVPLQFRVAALVFSLGAQAFTVWALWSLRSLFLLYAKGDVFSPRALRLVNDTAVALFAGVIVTFVMHAPITLLLTWPTGGHRSIALAFGSGDIATLFSAGVVLVISRVMVEARRIADENENFV